MSHRLAALIALLGLLSCTSPEVGTPGPMDVMVELDAFSGLPNPRWMLSSAEASELAARLQGLPPADVDSLPQAGLGYRGFWLRHPGGAHGIADSVHVSRGGLLQVFTGAAAGRILVDGRDAEGWLITLAKQRGYEAVFRE